MKTKLFTIIATLVAIAAIFATSCNVTDDNILSYDNETRIETVVPTTDAAQFVAVNNADEVTGTVTFTSDTQLAASAAYSDIVTIENGASNFKYTLKAIPDTEKEVNGVKETVRLTRDIKVYLRPAVVTKYRNYGYYAYPVRIRQYGTYTQYVNPENIETFIDKKDVNEQYYLIGKVLSVGSVETDTYPISKYPVDPQLLYERGAMPGLSEEQCPSNLSEAFCTLTLDCGGKHVKVLVNDLARDKFVENLAGTIKTGDEVEVSLLCASYNKEFGGIVNVMPQAVKKQ